MNDLELLKTLDQLVPEGAELRVVRDTPKQLHLVMPPPPDASLPDGALEQVAGGGQIGDGSQILFDPDIITSRFRWKISSWF